MKHWVQISHMPDPVLGLGLGPAFGALPVWGQVRHPQPIPERSVRGWSRCRCRGEPPQASETAVDREIRRKRPEGEQPHGSLKYAWVLGERGGKLLSPKQAAQPAARGERENMVFARTGKEAEVWNVENGKR